MISRFRIAAIFIILPIACSSGTCSREEAPHPEPTEAFVPDETPTSSPPSPRNARHWMLKYVDSSTADIVYSRQFTPWLESRLPAETSSNHSSANKIRSFMEIAWPVYRLSSSSLIFGGHAHNDFFWQAVGWYDFVKDELVVQVAAHDGPRSVGELPRYRLVLLTNKSCAGLPQAALVAIRAWNDGHLRDYASREACGRRGRPFSVHCFSRYETDQELSATARDTLLSGHRGKDVLELVPRFAVSDKFHYKPLCADEQ